MNPKAENPDLEVTGSSSRFNFIIPVIKQGTVPYQWWELELEHLPMESLSTSLITPYIPGDLLQALPSTKAQGGPVQSSDNRKDKMSRYGLR